MAESKANGNDNDGNMSSTAANENTNENVDEKQGVSNANMRQIQQKNIQLLNDTLTYFV